MNTLTIVVAVAAGLIGVMAGYALRWLLLLYKKSSVELAIKEKRLEAKEQASNIIEQAKETATEIKTEAREKAEDIRTKVADLRKQLNKKEQRLETKESKLAERSEKLQKAEKQLKEDKQELDQGLADIANMSQQEAKERLFERIHKTHQEEFTARKKKLRRQKTEKLQRRAQEILANNLQRIARPVAKDVLSSTVELSDDDLKGKIIGKNGRNIRAFQQATGVELVIDETPETVTISSYDPVRRAVAKRALKNLLADGRIQPARIERFVNEAEDKVKDIIQSAGEEAAEELSLLSLDDRVIAILGRLHFRTSYGQNVLEHSIEVGHVADLLAHELDLNNETARAGGLLHDIGKAVDHELKGSHVEIGMHVLTKFGVDQDIIDAMKSHHGDYEHESLEAVIVQVADAASGARPGARKQSLEEYAQRLQELESIAEQIDGVLKSFALEAGREIRVFVDSESVADQQAREIARQIATRIEKRVSYPGHVKVHVIRENRLVHYAR